MRRKKNLLRGFPERLSDLIYVRETNAIELGKRIGCDRKTIYAWKNGDTSPDIVMLVRLCDVLKTTPDYLLYGREYDRTEA